MGEWERDLGLECSHAESSVPLVPLGAVELKSELKVVEEGLVHALVEWQDDLDVVPAGGAAAGQACVCVCKCVSVSAYVFMCV